MSIEVTSDSGFSVNLLFFLGDYFLGVEGLFLLTEFLASFFFGVDLFEVELDLPIISLKL